MAKPKITRLGDPANPYTKVKVTAAQARASAARNPKPKKKASPAPAPAAKKKERKIGVLGQAWQRSTDRKIREAGG